MTRLIFCVTLFLVVIILLKIPISKMPSKDIVLKQQQKVDLFLDVHLPLWFQACVRVEPMETVFIYEGKRRKKKNLYSNFRDFLNSINVHEAVPPRRFLAKFENYLQSQNIKYHKHKVDQGLIMIGLTVDENQSKD